jgi:hypothetical protein
MNGEISVDRLRKQVAMVGAVVAGTLAMYWLVELLRGQVPDRATGEVKLTTALLSILTLALALVTRRPHISHKFTIAPMIVAPWVAAWSGVFTLPKYSFGGPGIATRVIGFTLMAVAFLVREPWRQSAAQSAVAGDEASPRR